MRTLIILFFAYASSFAQNIDLGIGGSIYKNDLILLNYAVKKN